MRSVKAIREVTRESFDSETGEIKHQSKVVELSTVNEPPYVKLYLNDISRLFGLPTKCTDILSVLVRKMDYDGYLSLGMNGKKRMAEELGFKNTQSIDNYLQTLKKKGILKPVGRGEYMLDPSLFAKGEWRDIYKKRKEFIKLTIQYDAAGNRSVKSEVV